MQSNAYKFFLISFFLILTLPLLSLPPWLHPAPWGKVILFRIIISILTFVFLWLALYGKINLKNLKFLLDRKSRVFWPFWLLIAFFAFFLLATVFSLDSFHSFWDSPYRAGGFLNFFFYLIFVFLAFSTIKDKDWLKLWKFSLIIGVLVSLVAILQYFEIFSQYLIPYEGRPPSTFGNPVFLAIYLLILTFMSFCFFLEEKQKKKKILYLLAALLFAFIILITGNRAVYLGLLIGFLYFLIFYPFKNKMKVLPKIIKASVVLGLVLVVLGIFYINKDPLPHFIQNNLKLKQTASRFSFDLILQESRFSVWKTTFEAIKERPVLGWGPENFSIAFDKHYSPDFPKLRGIWWDKAHNFIWEISTAAGLPALMIYLAFWSALFWQLHKSKKRNPQKALIFHAVQAVFIGYLTALFFSFDNFSTYLISFFLIAYSFHIIQKNSSILGEKTAQINRDIPLWKTGVVIIMVCLLIIFVWSYNLKLLKVNKDINWAVHYSKTGKCQEAVNTMKNYVVADSSVIKSYANLQYIDIIRNCLKENEQNKYTLAPKAVQILREEIKIKPYYTRAWTTLGAYLNILFQNREALKIENPEELLKEADSAFQEAHKLSPKREEVIIGWTETKLLLEDYEKMKELADLCISLNPNNTTCWWQKALAHIYLEELKEADNAINTAFKKGYNYTQMEKPLLQLQNAYIKILEKGQETQNKEYVEEAHKKLANVYLYNLLYFNKEDYQQRASLAYIYKELGKYREAREQSVFILNYSPESKDSVANFLDSVFSEDNNYFEHYFANANFYYLLGNKEKALEKAFIAQQYSKPETPQRKKIDKLLKSLLQL